MASALRNSSRQGPLRPCEQLMKARCLYAMTLSLSARPWSSADCRLFAEGRYSPSSYCLRPVFNAVPPLLDDPVSCDQALLASLVNSFIGAVSQPATSAATATAMTTCLI